MRVKAKFVKSSKELSQCPPPKLPEYAFIGRSNVGKSSLINLLAHQQNLAKTSQTPGKTQLINHFLWENKCFLVDLPGYGFAKVSKEDRKDWEFMIWEYLSKRENLQCIFVLVDSRLPLQKIDLEFMIGLGESSLPFAIIFTKTDKLSPKQLENHLQAYKEELLQYFELFPRYFLTSAEKKQGEKEILEFISVLNTNFSV